MKKKNIQFSCLGFSSADVFVFAAKDGRQVQIGFLCDCPELEFNYFGSYKEHLSPDEIPTAKEVLSEYNRQLGLTGVYINPKVCYAG